VSMTRPRSETEGNGQATTPYGSPESRETKPSFMTTEFWTMLLGVAAIVVIYNAASDISLSLWRACLLGTVFATGYIVSRGIAKSGSRDVHWRDDYDTGRR